LLEYLETAFLLNLGGWSKSLLQVSIHLLLLLFNVLFRSSSKQSLCPRSRLIHFYQRLLREFGCLLLIIFLQLVESELSCQHLCDQVKFRLNKFGWPKHLFIIVFNFLLHFSFLQSW
jgi:hypothetical protein